MIARVVGAVQELTPRALWRRFLRWVRVQQLRMELAGLEDELAHVRQMKVFEAGLEASILEDMRRVQVVLYHARRKGGV